MSPPPLAIYSTPPLELQQRAPKYPKGGGGGTHTPLNQDRHEKNQFEKFEHFDLIHLWKGLLSKVASDSLRDNYRKAFHGATKILHKSTHF